MIVLDSSAVLAIMFDEGSANALSERLAADDERVMSVASYLEIGTVLAGRNRANSVRVINDIQVFLDEAVVTLISVDEAQARVALRARIAFGRGMGHGGVLNYGDTFSYALAITRDAPLLFIGDDFSRTDVKIALPF